MVQFTYAIKYHITAECQTPLRTGGTDGDNGLVLTGTDGRPMIQGASIAGVMRSYLDGALADELFGDKNIENTSKITVSDGVFTTYTTAIRPRLKMNRDTGTGEDKLKFDLACIDKGAVLEFELLLKTVGRNETYEDAVVKILSAMNIGIITLGGQRSNGFGEVKLTDVKSHRFDMTTSEGRTDWINDAECKDAVTLNEITGNCVTFTLTGRCDSFIVKSGDTVSKKNEGSVNKENKNQKKLVATAMKSGGKYVLPASALKGVLRGRAQMIADYKSAGGKVPELFGKEPKKNKYGKETDPGTAGKVRVREFSLTNNARDISRTRIDRFTGGVMNKSLFTEETLADEVTITVEAFTYDKACLALLFYAMRDMAMGLYGFGGETGVGRGYLNKGAKLMVKDGKNECKFTFNDTILADEKAAFVTEWLKALDEAKEGKDETENN